MTVNVRNISITDAGGYNQFTITYTQTNNTSDLKIDEGSFKIYYSDGTSDPQCGFFSSLYPGETITRSDSFKALKGQTPICVEYAKDHFFSTEPMKDSLKWALQ